MAPDRSWLQNMVKIEQEGFKEYAQRWRELVAQVQPPIIEKEMVTMFIDTLPSPYYDKVVGNVASNFADLVVIEERIELGLRWGKLSQENSNTGFAKKPIVEKKKGETNAMLPTLVNWQCHTSLRTSCGRTLEQPPIQDPCSKAQESHLGQIIPLKPLEPPYPRSYDPNARCDYHGGVVGHAIKRCWSLKHTVQDLLDGGLLGLQDMAINAISHENWEEVERPNNREGEKELLISTPLCIEYVGGDEEALKTSFQALEIVGATSAERGRGDLRPSKAVVMAVKVLISNGFQPGRGLRKELDGMAKPVALQENPRRSRLGYMGPGTQGIQPNLYRYFTSGGVISPDQIAMIENQLPEPANLDKETTLWIDNATLKPNNASKSSKQDKGEDQEEKALIELERTIDQGRSSLQSGTEDLEVVRLGGEEVTKEIRVGK
ncbi:hypothetical protein CR513_44659, partial [Mucuna pruriens]